MASQFSQQETFAARHTTLHFGTWMPVVGAVHRIRLGHSDVISTAGILLSSVVGLLSEEKGLVKQACCHSCSIWPLCELHLASERAENSSPHNQPKCRYKGT